MRVAAVQFEADPASRTRTLQRALKALDAAAELDPAPDLVVLPAFLDTCLSESAVPLEKARGPGAAACAFRARTWGVFVAFGIAERATPRPGLKAVLLDHDGDCRVIQPLTRAGKSLAESYQCETGPLAVIDALIGRIAVLVDDDIVSEEAWREVVAKGAQLIVGTIGGAPVKAKSFESALTKLAKEFGRPCVVADIVATGQSAAERREGVSRIVDAAGNVVAAAKAGVANTIMAELKLPATSSSEEAMASGADES